MQCLCCVWSQRKKYEREKKRGGEEKRIEKREREKERERDKNERKRERKMKDEKGKGRIDEGDNKMRHCGYLFFQDSVNAVCKIRSSTLNLVDLAGSERQRDANTAGARLKVT